MAQLIKIPVTPGVDWVEAPGVGLRVLCGAPADAVKHLMKRGLISPREERGVTFESGPNAILLSDVMLQNGQFANLAEFPVLQMFYRQGMILPNHPNNTGRRPLIIGLPEQVKAQTQYIFRGNYGLLSKREMMQEGLDEETAEIMMRIKLRFAFGQIRPPQDLLDLRMLEDDPLEIHPGVMLRRLALNVFEFAHADETVTVDLNLGPEGQYEAPYTLGFQRIQREYFGVVHSGDGDGWDPTRPAMSSLLNHQGRIYLVDAGPNLLTVLNALGVSVGEIEGIFHSHSHDDHFAGLPTLMRSGRRIKYYAAPLVRASVARKLAALLSVEEERFADYFEIHDLTLGEWNDVEGLEVRPLLSPHPVETTLFQFRVLWEEGYRTYHHLADTVRFDVLRAMGRESPMGAPVPQAFIDQVEADYLAPADLKKVDIGQGLIHGDAADFRQDASRKIILSHSARPLTNDEMSIGSSAPFGVADVLIASKAEAARRLAFEYLRGYFPLAPAHQLRALLNAEFLQVNPGALILKQGERHSEAWLLVSGSVEMLRAGQKGRHLLPTGAIMGEISLLRGEPSPAAFRAASFVEALRLPQTLYLDFVRRNGLLARIERTHDIRAFLKSTEVLGEEISFSTQTRIAESVVRRILPEGALLERDEAPMLSLIKSGRASRLLWDQRLEELGPGDFFGEEAAVFDSPCLFRLRADTPLELYQIPGETLRDAPGVRLKLLEAHQRRMQGAAFRHSMGRMLQWDERCAVNVLRMDIQHRHLLEVAGMVMDGVITEGPSPMTLQAFRELIRYAMDHFRQEEALLREFDFPAIELHLSHHAQMEREVSQMLLRLEGESPPVSGQEFADFMERWVVNHIRTDDRQMGEFLNSQGVY
ncbi:MAG: cyclic nucleotide-binding domain-containing protein [Magnetococcales bacterium]|nr:cyclic nucleotide-binding domain-containing protein [Magnetococcales bacterium]